MNALIFLRAKGIMTIDCTKWSVKFKGGKIHDIINLMEEYAKVKQEEKPKVDLDKLKKSKDDKQKSVKEQTTIRK